MAHTVNGDWVWYELMTKDVAAAVAFYGEVAGWKTEAFGADYLMWVGARGPLGGVMLLPEEAAKMGAPPHWMGNLQVDDVDRAAARVKELGGKVYKEPFDVPTIGRVAIVADPQGASLAIFKPEQAMNAQADAQAGEVCWRELLTSDAEAAFAFYSDIVGWKSQEEMDMGPMGTYRIYGVGDRRLGGMMTTPKEQGMPPAWLFYVDVADLDAAISRATAMGAKVLNGPMEVPGGARVAQLMDPQGAAFALHQRPKS